MRKCDFCKKNGTCSIVRISECAVRDWLFFEPEEVDSFCSQDNECGAAPQICKPKYGHNKYFGCPKCGTKVGGYIITGGGENDWATHQDKFCSECGQKINWDGVDFFSITR